MRALLELQADETGDHILRKALSPLVLPQAEITDAARHLLEGTKSFAEQGKNLLAWLTLPPEARIAAFDDYASLFLTADSNVRAKLRQQGPAHEIPRSR